jgi:hypothetical protein
MSSWIESTQWDDAKVDDLNTPPPANVTLQDGSPATVTWSSHATYGDTDYKAANLFDPEYTNDYKDWISKDTFPQNKVEWVRRSFRREV